MFSFVRMFMLAGLSLLFLSISNCKSSSHTASDTIFQSDPPFTLTEASYQEWTAGTPQGGSGTNVSLKFKQLRQDIIPQQFYFKNKIGEVVSTNDDSSQYYVYYKNENTSDVIMDSDPTQEAQNTPPVSIPFDLRENEAVLSYLDQDVVLFYKITSMERKEPVFYPAAPPVDDN